MIKRAIFLIILIFVIIPMVKGDLTLDEVATAVQEPVQEAYETFFRQNTDGNTILLVDKGAGAFLICSLEKENTQLISILPTACPQGEDNSFSSIYKKEGIDGLKRKIEQTLCYSIAGYLEVDFASIGEVVDTLDGVQIEGKNYTGQELVGYWKSLSGNREGAKMQQNLILAIGRRFCTAGFWKGQSAMWKLLRIAQTDLSVSALLKIGKALVPALEGEGMHQYCLPTGGSWSTFANPA